MKKIVLLAFAFLLSNCDTNDDGFYNNVFINVPNLVSIENPETSYSVGEKLYVSSQFPRILNDGALIDIFQTTGANEFVFTYIIEKRINSTEWEVVSVNDNQLDIVKGNAQNGSFVYAICQFNTVSNLYEYRVGFPLLTAGTYRMSFGYNSESKDSVELRSLSPSKRLVLNIDSEISGLDTNGYYNFTVN